MKPFVIVHEDESLVVVDKAAGVLTVPTPRRERNTLVDLLSKALRMRQRLFVVHRLDRETSGLLVFAKRDDVGRALVANWLAAHERRYTAIVHGAVAKDADEIVSRMITKKNLDRRSTQDGTGEQAVTRYRVVQRLAGATHLDVELDTGRRNQIRVHMKDIGHPILGDERYGQGMSHPRWPRGVLALHARVLVLVHPRTKERLAFEAPLPGPFTKLLAGARR